MKGVVTIKLQDANRPSDTLKSVGGTRAMTDRERSLAVLLGGYNMFGRGIDLDKYHALAVRFDSLVCEMEDLIIDRDCRKKNQ